MDSTKTKVKFIFPLDVHICRRQYQNQLTKSDELVSRFCSGRGKNIFTHLYTIDSLNIGS